VYFEAVRSEPGSGREAVALSRELLEMIPD